MRERISRGEFVYGIAVAGLVAAASCLAPPAPTAPSQSAAPAEGVRRERLPVIGYLAFGVPQVPALVRLRESFRLGLQNFGWEDGKNVVVEYRYAEGQAARVPELVSELVSLPVDLILAADSNVVPAAKEATSTIPIVMALFSDPVGAGLAQSLARPGGSVTGMSNLNRPLAAKRVETLRELLPELNQAAVLWNSQPPRGPAPVAGSRAGGPRAAPGNAVAAVARRQ